MTKKILAGLAWAALAMSCGSGSGGSGGSSVCSVDDYTNDAKICNGTKVLECKQSGTGYVWQVDKDCADTGRTCGMDGCEGACVRSCAGKSCGSDGCGYTCGSCPSGQTCTAAGTCTGGGSCTPNCAGKSCGADGCGSTCGSCPSGQSCVAGECLGSGDQCAACQTAGDCLSGYECFLYNDYPDVTFCAAPCSSDLDCGDTARFSCAPEGYCVPLEQSRCVGNAVYVFDGCDNQLGLQEQCSSTQQCSNGACSGGLETCDPCTSGECAPGYGCYGWSEYSWFVCGKACTSDYQCTSGMRCNTSIGYCVDQWEQRMFCSGSDIMEQTACGYSKVYKSCASGTQCFIESTGYGSCLTRSEVCAHQHPAGYIGGDSCQSATYDAAKQKCCQTCFNYQTQLSFETCY